MFGGKGSVNLVTESIAIARVVIGSVTSSRELDGTVAATTLLITKSNIPKVKTDTHKMLTSARLLGRINSRARSSSDSFLARESVKACLEMTVFLRAESDSADCPVISVSSS